MIKRLAAVWHARNLEFVRDRSTMLFTLLLPIALVVGMSFVFGGKERPLFKVGVIAAVIDKQAHPFLSERYVEFVPVADQAAGVQKVTHQQIDLLLDLHGAPRYWVNTDSPKGYIVEKLLLASAAGAHREPVTGAAVRYVDYLFPGILGMNMMFSCLFGVGYVVLRYRKSGFLKRLHATPLTAFEFLTAQVLSRLALILFVTGVLYVGIGTIIHFHRAGSALLLILVARPGRSIDGGHGTHDRGAILQRGTGGRPVEPAHLADDVAVGSLVLLGRLAPVGALGRRDLSAHPCSGCRPCRHDRRSGGSRKLCRTWFISRGPRSFSSPLAPGHSAGATNRFGETACVSTVTTQPRLPRKFSPPLSRPIRVTPLPTATIPGRSGSTRRWGNFFGTEVRAFAVTTGTAANSLSLATLSPPWGAIYAHEEGHIGVDECGAPQFFTGGAQLVSLLGENGKVTCEALRAAVDKHPANVHTVQPAVVSLTQATELGTVYRPAEIAAISKLARERGLAVQMDGARFANAVAFLDCHPGDVTWRAGVDVLSFGATKNGALAAEAVVFFNRERVRGF